MATTVTIDVKKIRRFLLNPNGVIYRRMLLFGEQVKEQAQINLQGHTSGENELAKSIRSEIDSVRGDRTTTVRVIANTRYAKFVELGTEPHWPDESSKAPIKNITQWAESHNMNPYQLQWIIWTQGTPALHFLRDALRRFHT